MEITKNLPNKLNENESFSKIENNVHKRVKMLQKKLDSLNNVKDCTTAENSEQFNLILQELEAFKNYLLCQDMKRQLDELEHDPGVKLKIEAQMNAYKAWWQLASNKIIQNYGNIANRNLKKDQGDKMLDAMNITDMHRLLRGEIKDDCKIEDIEDPELRELAMSEDDE